MPGRALTPNEISGSTLLSACERSRSWRHALQHLRWGQGARKLCTIGWNAAASACVDVWPQGLALLVPWLHTVLSLFVVTCTVRHACVRPDSELAKAMEILPDTISFLVFVTSCASDRIGPREATICYLDHEDSVTFGTAITGLKQGRRWRFATVLLGSMAILRVQEVCRSFSSCSSACEQESLWEPVLTLLRRMRIVSIQGDEVGTNSLLSACGQHGHWGLALGALHGMPGGQLAPDQISMNSVIAACRTGALWRLALRLLCRCVLVELLPSAVTFNSVLGSLEPETSWSRLLASLNHMRDHLVSPSIISFNTGIQLLEKSPCWSRSLQLLALAGRLCVRRDAVSLTVVLNSIVGSSRSSLWFWALAAIAGARREALRASDAGLGVAIQSAVSGSRWSRALDLLHEGLPTELSRLAAVEACEMGSLHRAAASLLGEVTETTSSVMAAVRNRMHAPLSCCDSPASSRTDL
ncbi:CRP1 [Symbiodinium sp. CCMP2456]|nr:CRP1 [Symbiodinium sp. CCMP2456]